MNLQNLIRHIRERPMKEFGIEPSAADSPMAAAHDAVIKVADFLEAATKNEEKLKPCPLSNERVYSLGNDVRLEMVLIPAGEFLMGSPCTDKNSYVDEKPQRRVRITRPFYLGKYPVTQAQWEAVMGNNPSQFEGPRNPVKNVSWGDCQDFLKELNEKFASTPVKFALPTEAQWEYACRAGSTTRYCFGDNKSDLGEYAWYMANSGYKTRPVGEKKANAWGLYDMHGNVWEWCADWFDGGYYGQSPTDDPVGPTTGSSRVYRGGSWHDPARNCRSANRYYDRPGLRNENLGLRVSLHDAGFEWEELT